MSDKYDEVASLIYFDDDGQGRTSRERIAAILRRAYPAASAQSAEPQEGYMSHEQAHRYHERLIDKAKPQEAEAFAEAVGWIVELQDKCACSMNEEDRFLDVKKAARLLIEREAALRARLASKPSRSDAHELDAFRHAMVMAFQEIRRTRRDEGMSEWADDDMANWVITHMSEARPSREEEMRAAAKYSTWNIDVVDRNLTSLQGHALKMGDEYAQRWLSNARSYLAGARAALAQGGAREQGKR